MIEYWGGDKKGFGGRGGNLKWWGRNSEERNRKRENREKRREEKREKEEKRERKRGGRKKKTGCGTLTQCINLPNLILL